MYVCPKCGSSEILSVEAGVSAWVDAFGRLEAQNSDLRFEPNSRMDCGVCGHHAPACKFGSSPPSTRKTRIPLHEENDHGS